jgi:hypothetical protein
LTWAGRLLGKPRLTAEAWWLLRRAKAELAPGLAERGFHFHGMAVRRTAGKIVLPTQLIQEMRMEDLSTPSETPVLALDP